MWTASGPAFAGIGPGIIIFFANFSILLIDWKKNNVAEHRPASGG
jgi:hypothetical protein